ncbi:MAG: hypothetical protein P8Z50_06490 [candidate division WOR-3 bacterium]|jgi:hypothetical protein
MERKIIFLSFVLFVLLITGCGGEDTSSASSKDESVVVADYSPAQPTSSDAIIMKVTAVTKENPEYDWTVNGVPAPVSGNKLSAEYFFKGDTVFCSILIGGEESKKIGPIIIKNSPPEIISVEPSPPNPRHGTDLSLNTDVTDADEDDVTLHARWFVNGEEVSTGEVLSGSEIKAADQVYALVRPYDGTDEGLPVNTGWVLVQNSPPEFTESSPRWEERLMNYDLEVKDPDGDNVELLLEESPPGMRLEGTKLIWESPEVERDTSFNVTVKARDERGGETSLSFSLDIKKREVK